MCSSFERTFRSFFVVVVVVVAHIFDSLFLLDWSTLFRSIYSMSPPLFFLLKRSSSSVYCEYFIFTLFN